MGLREWLDRLDQRVFAPASTQAGAARGSYSPYADLLGLLSRVAGLASIASTAVEVATHRRPVLTAGFLLVGLLLGALAGYTIGVRIATLAAYAPPAPARAALAPGRPTPLVTAVGLLVALPLLVSFPTIVPGLLVAATAQFALQRAAVRRAESALGATLLAPAHALLVAEEAFRVTRSSAAPPP
ncbi:MAG: hypothetical protein NVSMB13_20380 [Mycobacteriales bacterium]